MAEDDGIIFEIREFCLHDGPGIRTTVFLKGCPLRCLWCHNPEGQEMRPQKMTSAAIACIGCGGCRKVCKHHEGCVACGECVPVCPERRLRIAGKRVTPAELAEIVLHHKNILGTSGGGVTFSGGEPLAQIDFLCNVTSLLKPMHIAVETCGYASAELYSRMLSVVDLVLQDWKCFDEALHRRLTGVSNERIKANIRLLSQSEKDFILRLPLVPGYNDSDAELEAAALFFAEIKTPFLKEIQLLPYHGGAEGKYRQLGISHEPLKLLTTTINQSATMFFTSRGLPCSFPYGAVVMADSIVS